MRKIFFIFLVLALTTNCNSQESTEKVEAEISTSNDIVIDFDAAQTAQWRGENRDGKYPDTGLLNKWSTEGPKLLWHYDLLGPGHASAAVTNNFVYTAGVNTVTEMGFIIAFDHSGKTVWKKVYAKEWVENWDGVRSTPIIDGEKLYILSSYGVVVCMNSKNGDKIWSIDLMKDYNARNIEWGFTENLVIEDDKLFCTAGAEEANVVALDKNSGNLIWKCKGNGEKSAYNSPFVINHNNKKIFITMTESSILGIEVESGKLLWSFSQPNKYSVHANTPTYKDGMLYCVSGYGKGSVMLKLADDGNSVTEMWRDENLDNKMGGVILLDGIIYGSGHFNRKWYGIDWKTGNKHFYHQPIRILIFQNVLVHF